MGGIVLRHFGLHAHPFHFDFVHFEDARITFFQAFFEEGKQLAGILRPLLQQGVLLVEHYQVEAKVLGTEQDIAACRLLPAVESRLLPLARLAACTVKRREIESLCHDQFGTGHAGDAPGVERAVFHRRVFEVVFRLHFEFRGERALPLCLKLLVVLLHLPEHFVYGLCLHRRYRKAGYG